MEEDTEGWEEATAWADWVEATVEDTVEGTVEGTVEATVAMEGEEASGEIEVSEVEDMEEDAGDIDLCCIQGVNIGQIWL